LTVHHGRTDTSLAALAVIRTGIRNEVVVMLRWSHPGLQGGLLSPMFLAVLTIGAPAQAKQTLAGPASGVVDIIRDAFGVPHIFGPTSAAVVFGSGYAIATDRLAELELTIRRTNGRLAAIEGPNALASDRAARLTRPSDAELLAMYRGLSADHRRLLSSFLRGVNARIERVRAKPDSLIPYEYTGWGVLPEPISLTDFLGSIAVYVAWVGFEVPLAVQNLRFYQRLEAKYGSEEAKTIFDDVLPLNDPAAETSIAAEDNLAPPAPPYHPSLEMFRRQTATPASASTAQGAAQFGSTVARDPFLTGRFSVPASRCFTVGPSRSATGHVLMQQTTGDGPELHLAGGGFDVAGFSLLPLGTPVMGRGRSHGWLVTSGETNTNVETYAERLNPANRFQYWFRGAWHDMERRSAIIAVKGQKPDTAELAYTVHGPVIAWDAEHGSAFSVRYAARSRELYYWLSVVEMGRARSFAEFEAAVALQPADLGICYGDESGKIAWWQTSRTPHRPLDVDPRLPTPGTGEYEWNGFLTLAEKPHAVNPKAGYFYSWNGKPTPDYSFRDNWRSGKAFHTWVGHRLMATHPRVMPNDLREFNRIISHWTLNPGGTDPGFFLPALVRAAAASGRPSVVDAVGLIRAWDGEYRDGDRDGRYDSAGLIIYQEWLRRAKAAAFEGILSGPDAAATDNYRTDLLLRLVEGSGAGVPLRHDYLGRPVDAFLAETLDSTLTRLAGVFPGQPMTEWKQPVYWRYYDGNQVGRDSTRPIFVPEQITKMRRFFRTSARLGLTPAAVPDNGAEYWMVLMDVSRGTRSFESCTEGGGQSQFIDRAGHGNPHLGDQYELHLNFRMKPFDMDEGRLHQAVTAGAFAEERIPVGPADGQVTRHP
jgi:acyl-homoserine lactone acylase PvdQ